MQHRWVRLAQSFLSRRCLQAASARALAALLGQMVSLTPIVTLRGLHGGY